jgi:high affinity cGMP-specific 3',5'-cyclic phosphodiesterase 9
LDHDGYNNAYQINARTHLAIIYNDQSPLENYHCAVAFHILNKTDCNILSSFDESMYKKFRANCIQ